MRNHEDTRGSNARARVVAALWTIATTTVVAAQATVPSPDEQAQIKKGGQVVAQACAACHTTITRMLQVHKQTRDEWKSTVYFMISRGAQVMPDEIEPVAAFLFATAGKKPDQPKR